MEHRRGGGRGLRMHRGDIRGLLLAGLLHGPAHGYHLMRVLESDSGGAWSPSPGSVYPTLQMLEEEGLLTATSDSGRKTYALTAQGQTAAKAAAQDPKPWEHPEHVPGRYPLRDLVGAVHAAAKQVGTEGSPDQVEKAIDILRSARQQLYRLLAED